jgi:hypothetical protein
MAAVDIVGWLYVGDLRRGGGLMEPEHSPLAVTIIRSQVLSSIVAATHPDWKTE